jgi:rod shape determining protein RodA
MAGIRLSKNWKHVDWLLLLNITALVVYGLVSIAAAMATASTGAESTLAEKLVNLDLTLVLRQALWFLVGLVVMAVVMMVDYTVLMEYAPVIYWINIVILILLYVMATVTKGTVSWYNLGGIGFQPSELMKISLMLILARLFSKRPADQKMETIEDFWQPFLFMIIPFLLIALQPDMGTALVILSISVGIMLIVGMGRKLLLTIAGTAAVSLPLVWLMLSDMQRSRIMVFFKPTADLTNSGYNVLHSKIAIGSGQWLGKGIFAEGNLTQLNWVPVKESDFIFTVTGEIFGFIGGLILLLLFGLLLYRTLRIALRARDRFGSLVVIGVATMIFVHMFENIGMTMGLLPVTGIPLPFISYGGSNMVTNMLAFGLVLNIGSKW